jgi:hypothetical protein
MSDANAKSAASAWASARGSAAPVLSGNVPQQISYSGQNFIQLDLLASMFIATAAAKGVGPDVEGR